jgi:hypothetical protein
MENLTDFKYQAFVNEIKSLAPVSGWMGLGSAVHCQVATILL